MIKEPLSEGCYILIHTVIIKEYCVRSVGEWTAYNGKWDVLSAL
jgi:hypothetical protein